MLLHQTMSSAPHYEQLQTQELESLRAAALCEGHEGSVRALRPSRVTLTPLDTQTNGAVLSHLAELAGLAAAGEGVQAEDFFSTSPLVRPHSQLVLEEQQKQLRGEIRFLKEFLLTSLSADGAGSAAASTTSSSSSSSSCSSSTSSSSSSSLPAEEGKVGTGRGKGEEKKTYCSSCGTHLFAAAGWTGDAQILVRERVSMWKQLSDPAREQFFWQHPGLPYSASTDVNPIPTGGKGPDGAVLPPPDTFLLLLLLPKEVKYLRLADNYAQKCSLFEELQWTSARVTP
jgi:hypothetical protein